MRFYTLHVLYILYTISMVTMLIGCVCYAGWYQYILLIASTIYSTAPQIGPALLLNNSVLIRESPFGEREHHRHSQYLVPRICVLSRGVVLRRICALRGTTVVITLTCFNVR